MPELDNDQVIQLVKSRLGLDETVVAEVRLPSNRAKNPSKMFWLKWVY